jgi:hypothetical protein
MREYTLVSVGWVIAKFTIKVHIIFMSERIDLSKVNLGAAPETVKKWEEAGAISAAPLPEGTRAVATEKIDQQMAAEGRLYGPLPGELLNNVLKTLKTKRVVQNLKVIILLKQPRLLWKILISSGWA